MPLDVVRLRDSDLAATASDAEFRAAIMLWCVSWHQIPASSLPDDDAVLAMLSGFGRGPSAVAEWMKCREGALRGFVKASDGRLYHTVIVEKALEAWERKQARSVARVAHAEKMKRWRDEKTVTPKASDDHVTVTRSLRDDNVTSLTGTGTGTGTGKEKKDKTLGQNEFDRAVLEADLIGSEEPKGGTYPAAFETFWKVYPRKIGKMAAFKAWKRAKMLCNAGLILNAVEVFAKSVKGKDPQFTPHPATWLNGGRWDDENAGVLKGGPVGRDSFGVGG
jgi:hypothetical protein